MSTGTDFWLAMPVNAFDIGEFFEGIDQTPDIDILISSALGATGTISDPGAGFQQNWTVGADGVADISLPLSVELNTEDGIQDLGIHVVSNNNPISVYAINNEPYSADSYVAIATPALGTQYRVMAYENDLDVTGSRFDIVATQDDTTVTLTPGPYDVEPMPATVTLNAGQVFQFEDDGTGADVTGTLIQSNKPVAVIGGNYLADVPNGDVAADMLMAEMPPTNDWGTSFVTSPLATRDGDTFRVLANQNGTVVQINGQNVATLYAGQYYETVLTAASQITSNNPVLLAQFANSQSFDNQTGDPTEMIVPPTDEFATQYTVGVKSYADSSNPDQPGFNPNYVNLVVPVSAVNEMLMNGTPLSSSLFTDIGNTGYAYAQILVAPALPVAAFTFSTPGDDVKFDVTVYGFSTYNAYGNAAGFGGDSAEYAQFLTLSPSTEGDYVGTQASVTATVLGPDGQPVIETPVTFTVEGSNPQTGMVYTNAQGQAVFTYQGTTAGTDVIQATVPSNGQVLVADAVKNWQQVTPTIQIQSPANDSQFTVGTTVLVSGTASPGAPGVPIVSVTINGQPVDVLDAAGDFFTQVTLPAGSTTLTFVATDSLGDTASTTITLTGVTAAVAAANDSNLVPDANFVRTYYRTSFDEQTKTLYADVSLQNSGQYPLDAPLYLAVTDISDPTVQLRNYAGVLSDGTAYYC